MKTARSENDLFSVDANLNGQLLKARGAKGTVLVGRKLAWSYAQEFAARGAYVVVRHQNEIVWTNR